jgi:2-iminobutanoate/2-iminopropanoate deaminase
MSALSLIPVFPAGTRRPAGHYAPAVIHAGIVYVSGQLPIDALTGQHETGPIEAQAELVLRNLDRILIAAGSTRDLVIQTTVYTSDVRLWDQINSVYAQYFGNHRPARAVVPTAPLHHGFLIEISAVAATSG